MRSRVTPLRRNQPRILKTPTARERLGAAYNKMLNDVVHDTKEELTSATEPDDTTGDVEGRTAPDESSEA